MVDLAEEVDRGMKIEKPLMLTSLASSQLPIGPTKAGTWTP